MKNIFLIVFLLVFSQIAQSEDITEQSFYGNWCGKWDGIYKTCLTIKGIEQGSLALYQWQEQTYAKFKKTDKIITRMNRNTLKIDNIIFIINESDLTA